MKLRLEMDLPSLKTQLDIRDPVMLLGSCFTEHIARRLSNYKFKVHENPAGILFNPASMAQTLENAIRGREFKTEDLFNDQGVWASWDHHSRFSSIDRDELIHRIQIENRTAGMFLKQAQWLILTFGSAYVYQLNDGRIVANCHRAPANVFQKRLMSTEEVMARIDQVLHQLWVVNPEIKVICTVSPVRHIREGFVENNRSKAVLIQATHQLVDKFDRMYYFPAYELVVDDLRDYRFYAEDMVHPNYMATGYVWEKFLQACVKEETRVIISELDALMAARNHRPRLPEAPAHQAFLQRNAAMVSRLSLQYPFLDLEEELRYFTSPVS